MPQIILVLKDIHVESVSGVFPISRKGTNIYKTYTNVSNVIASLSCGPECDESTLLVNAHFDSATDSPGAADNGLGVSVVFEVLRVLSNTRFNLNNRLVIRKFLFLYYFWKGSFINGFFFLPTYVNRFYQNESN